MRVKFNSIIFIRCCVVFLLIISGCNENSDPEQSEPLPKMFLGVFGGSISCYTGSEIVRDGWQKEMNIVIESNGIGGAGFSSVSSETNICHQITNAQKYDVYLLWASTNDVVKAEIGNTDTNDDRTQAGGIKKAYHLIKEKNKDALILFFTSLPRFDYFYFDKTLLYVKGQIDVCKSLNIAYLDQNLQAQFSKDNYHAYYYDDKVHLTPMGYQYILPIQNKFLLQHINSYYRQWLIQFEQN